jgi:membrane protein implicated in regulation of membrane protease activity
MAGRPRWVSCFDLANLGASFWLFAGRGIDSLSQGRFISAFEAFSMGVVGLCFGVLAIVLACDPGKFGEAYMRWMALPGVMWIAFSVICLFAWWKQRRARCAEETAPSL